jgi:hypothetical protein
MITGLRHFRFGALTATASLLVGVSAAAAGIYTLTDPLAFTNRPVITHQAAQAPADEDVQGVWTAPLAEAMTVDLRAPTHNARPLAARLARAVVAPPSEAQHETTCTEQWHRMAEGPAGRLVADVCPGEAPLPLPAEEPTKPGLTLLPTLRVLGSPLRGQPLDPDSMPRQDPTAVASIHSLDQTLTTRFEASAPHDFDRPLPDSGSLIRDPGPLDWEPHTGSTKDTKTAASAAQQCSADRNC